MFERIIEVFFVKTKKKSGITVISGNREIKNLDIKGYSAAYKKTDAEKRKDASSLRSEIFWNNRGRAYGAIFNSLNGRLF